MNTIKIFDFCTRNPSRLDELVKIRISDGFVKSPRSRVADRDSELERFFGDVVDKEYKP